jgi:ATP synthase F1 delta subunit
MIVAQAVVAKKYAQAFLNVFDKQITYEDFTHFCLAADFFTQNKQLLFFLSWPIINTQLKVKALKEALKVFRLNKQCFGTLIDLLATHKRTFLIMEVLKQLCVQYKVRHNIMKFSIRSSHELEKEDLDILSQFLVNLTAKDIIYDYAIEKKLIAGIRLQSSTYLWECSINKQLMQIKLAHMH